MRAAILSLLLLAPALAGCVNPLEPAATDGPGELPVAGPGGPAALPSLPVDFLFACPPGETVERASSGLCVGSIASATESEQEPFVAIHPTNPDVVAVGVNAGHTVGAARATDDGAEARPVSLDVHVSEDGGATWRRAQVPLPEGALPARETDSGDPALAFADDGTLHVSGLVSPRGTFRGLGIFYASSPDLGRTWSEPVLLAPAGDNDRNWLTLAGGGARVYVPWQHVGDSSEVAWSLDGGATWRTQNASQRAEDCITASPVVEAGGAPLFACAGYQGRSFTGVEVHALDVATGDLRLVARLPDVPGVWPQLATLPGGGLVLVADVNGTTVLARSDDGGRSWSAPVDLRGLATVDDPWPYSANYWMTTDPWGAVHVLLGGMGFKYDFGAFRAMGETRVAHLAIDPHAMALVSERALSAPAMEDERAPPSLAPSYGDHYYGLAFSGEKGFVAWTHDKGVDYALVAPLWNGTAT